MRHKGHKAHGRALRHGLGIESFAFCRRQTAACVSSGAVRCLEFDKAVRPNIRPTSVTVVNTAELGRGILKLPTSYDLLILVTHATSGLLAAVRVNRHGARASRRGALL